MVLFALVALLELADAGTDATRALELYQAQNYAEACPLMKRVAEQQRNDSAAWSDYGLCLVRESPFKPPEAARQALHQAWKVAGTASLRASALFNLTLFFRAEGEGLVLFTDARCPGRAVAINARKIHHTIGRSTASTSELTACSTGTDGGCIDVRTSRLSLGGDAASVDPLPSASCYPEAQAQRACDEVLEGTGLTRAQKQQVRVARGSCEALELLVEKRLEKISKECTADSRVVVDELEKDVASFPRWNLSAIDVCGGQLEASRGKKVLKVKLGEQTDAMGAEEQ